jgi:cob(I)alamin adenosyltransferase
MIQVYTGDGKGKTTAALGLSLRAAGAGKNVYIGQFIKGKHYSELSALKKFKNVKVEQFGRGCFIKKSPSKIDLILARKGLEKIKKIIAQGKFDVIILDEANVALDLGLLETKEVTDIIRAAPRETEIVLTGRNAPRQIIAVSDLVSHIKDVRHYYRNGIRCRRGIEF